MSVNITVNGKFIKQCKPHPLLQDPVKAKKDEEEERRKLRLLQVREQSKKFAEKIRKNVQESMRREQEKYEALKAKEYECWRDNEMHNKMHDYRSAVFQFGTAHMAAQKENRQRVEKKLMKCGDTYEQYRKRMAAKRNKSCKDIQNNGPCICDKIHVCVDKQYQCTCKTADMNISNSSQKRKRDEMSFSSDESETNSDEDTCNDVDSSLSSCALPTATTTTTTTARTASNNRATQTTQKLPSKNNLKKTPPVYLDVSMGSDESVLITAPADVKDTHSEYNQQFSSIIRISPRKAKRGEDNKKLPQSPKASKSQTHSPRKEKEKSPTKSPSKSPKSPPKARAIKEKRFTLISDLVKKQKEEPMTSGRKSPSPTRRQEQTAHDFAQTSPLSKSRVTTATSMRPPVSRPISPKVTPRKGSAMSSKSSQFVATNKKRPSVTSAVSATTYALGSISSNSGRVQFYDYNSKLSKDTEQEKANVTVNRQNNNGNQPTAMEQASAENVLQKERQQDILNKNKQMEERGIRALERQQVRRDCDDLTEKLEALTRQYPRQLPTAENSQHLFADKQLRKEGKMNIAVENLLSRPNIITCSEVNQRKMNGIAGKPLSTNNYGNEINVASNSCPPQNDISSSDSCCSILLGYVDDQTRQVRKDLEEWPCNSNNTNDKQTRLKNLLKRLDKMRETLAKELIQMQSDNNNQENPSSKEEQMADLIDCLSKCRQEREDIMIDTIVPNGKEYQSKTNEKTQQKPKDANDQKPLEEREKELQLKENILEQKVREFYELQKQRKKQNSKFNMTKGKSMKETDENDDDLENKENINCSPLDTPVEIVITVKGETKSITIPGKTKQKSAPKKKPAQLATLIKSPQPAKKLTPKKKPNTCKASGVSHKILGRQNSYDSNSTSYMSLPSQIPNDLGNMVDNLQQPVHSTSEECSLDSEMETERRQRGKVSVPSINPLVAQYVQRLLGMSSKAVKRLQVSSSEIETPSSSIINTPENAASHVSLVSEERLAMVESFMEDNRSFIMELEQSLKINNNNSTMENSMKVIDDIWRKRLKQPKKQMESKTKHTNAIKPGSNKKSNVENNNKTSKEKPLPSKDLSKKNKVIPSKEKENPTKSGQNKAQPKTSEVKGNNENSDTEVFVVGSKNSYHRPIKKDEKAVETRLPDDSNTSEAHSQIVRYAQLTENCTHRIAELTALINRVRQEKQRLLEVTLSSVSDNGRQSTEYLELPNCKSHSSNENSESTPTSSSDDGQQNKQSANSIAVANSNPKLCELEKNCHITASQDSGIADSRPITAQENCHDIEPISHTSTESHGPHAHQQQRKLKPPPVLKRFSPQFQEEELVHELSTILEVDTPANSRINTAIAPTSGDDRLCPPEILRQPIQFPSFKEYCRQLNLDVTILDKEQSIMLQKEFSLYIEDLQRSQEKDNPQYQEFPSINAFLDCPPTNCQQSNDTIVDETLGQMRVSNICIDRFPDLKAYVQKCQEESSPPTDDLKMLDTESLENITDLPTHTNTDNDNDTASLDIEMELKKRNILKKSFRYSQNNQIFSSTAHHDGQFYNDVVAVESGVEKLSTSDNTMSLIEADMQRLVQQWPMKQAIDKNKNQRHVTISSTSTSSQGTKAKDKLGKCQSLEESSSPDAGQPLNLHEFLKRELLKHANNSDTTTSTSTTSSDFTLRSQFLHSLIGTLTPGATTSKSGQQTLERQKTSTPVPLHSSRSHITPNTSNPSRASTSSQLFSGESNLSSVHGADGSNRCHNTSEGIKGDQSSN